MDVRVEEIAPCKKRVTVTVPPEKVREEVDSRYGEINKSLALPGFRPGHAPRRILEARFGPRVAEEVKKKIVESSYEALVEEKKVAPLSRPVVDVEKAVVDPEKPFEFTFEVTTRPEFDLPAWKGLEVKVPAIVVGDADVDAYVERLRVASGTLVPAEGGLATDDVAVLDWVAKDGETALGSDDNAYYRVGTGVLEGIVVDGLDAALAGAVAGATKTLPGRAAPDDPRETLAGRSFEVTVTVRDVKRFRPADLDAEFLKRHDYDDVAELRQDARRRVVRARERERDRLAEDRLVAELVRQARIPLPEEVVRDAVTGWIERRRVEGEAEGIPAEQITKEAAAAEAEVRTRVEGDLRRHFVLEKVCEAEKVEVSEAELLGAVEQIARDSGRPSGEVAAHFQEDPARLLELRSHLRHQKAREALRRAASVVEEAPAAPAAAAPPPKAEAPRGKAGPKKGK